MNEIWIARDKFGLLFLFYTKPVRRAHRFEPDVGEIHEYEQLNEDSFPFVTWRNSPLKLILDIEAE